MVGGEGKRNVKRKKELVEDEEKEGGERQEEQRTVNEGKDSQNRVNREEGSMEQDNITKYFKKMRISEEKPV